MKLGTIVENGAFRTVILTAQPGEEGQILIDISDAVELLKTHKEQGRLHWIGSWSGPWGEWTAPRDMIDIVRFGWEAVAALERLERIVWAYARSGDGAWARTVLKLPDQVTWQPPIPDPPAYFYFHNNSTVSLNFQFVDYGRRKVYHPRNRPMTALIGTGEPLFADEDDRVKTDMEFGFVVGPEARHVSSEEAMDYVFGYTVCTDSRMAEYSKVYGQMREQKEHRHVCAGALLDKATDGYGGVGPVLVTADEVGNPHDLMAYIYCNDILRGRSHTSGYLDPVRDIVSYFSRIMTVPPGTLFAMGAAAYDGYGVFAEFRQPGQNHVAIEFERVGVLRHPLVYRDESQARERGDQSPYLWRCNKLGLPGPDVPDLNPEQIPAVARSFWALSHNVNDPTKGEYPTPYLYPRSSLARAEDNIILSEERRDVEISVQLAAVVGPKACYRIKRDEVFDHLLGLALFIGIQDLEIYELGCSDTVYSSPMFAYFQSRFGDGFNRIGQVVPTNELPANWRQARMKLEIEGIGSAEGNVADYDCDIPGMIEWISRGVTQLPGDIHVLGPSRAALRIPMTEERNGAYALRASIDGFPAVETRIEDRRDPNFPPWRGLRIGPRPDHLLRTSGLR